MQCHLKPTQSTHLVPINVNGKVEVVEKLKLYMFSILVSLKFFFFFFGLFCFFVSGFGLMLTVFISDLLFWFCACDSGFLQFWFFI